MRTIHKLRNVGPHVELYFMSDADWSELTMQLALRGFLMARIGTQIAVMRADRALNWTSIGEKVFGIATDEQQESHHE